MYKTGQNCQFVNPQKSYALNIAFMFKSQKLKQHCMYTVVIPVPPWKRGYRMTSYQLK